MTASKRCTGCGEVKPLDAFYRCAAVRDGRAARCKVCRDEAHRAYYADRADVLREYGREQRRRWTANNPEMQRNLNRRGRRSEAGRAAQARKRQRRRDAGVPDSTSVEWARDRLVVLERDDGVCGICGIDVDPLDYTLDHIQPISAGGQHEMHNLQVAHRSCNSRKYTSETA